MRARALALAGVVRCAWMKTQVDGVRSLEVKSQSQLGVGGQMSRKARAIGGQL